MSNHERQMSASGKERVASAVPPFKALFPFGSRVLLFLGAEKRPVPPLLRRHDLCVAWHVQRPDGAQS
jgi:hypothetical protein